MNEIWKDIVNYKGSYMVSNLGKIKSNLISGPQITRNDKTFKILKQIPFKKSNTTHKRISLSANGISKQYSVHRIVAEAFLNNPMHLPIVNHIDNNGENNRIDNLEWCTQSYNLHHAQKQERLFEAQSKGGTTNGKIRNSKSLEFINNYIGTTICDWKIIDIDKDTIEIKQPRRIICQCMRCNKIQSVLFHSVKIERSKMCKSCAQKQRHLDKINTKAKI